jgi:hypothetical protein
LADVAPDANPPDLAADPDDDEARLAAIARRLAEEVDAVVPAWVERLVVTRVEQWRGDVPPAVAADASAAGAAAGAEVRTRLRALLEADIDDQRAGPLEVLRAATRHAHDVLAALGMPPVVRDEFAERSFPDDAYDLMPATWSDVDPALHEPGIAWGAAKAFVHKARRRAEGMG